MMIETLLKRRTNREFLKSYSEEQWKDLIPTVFEIGVLSLEKSFNKILFTKDELKDIIEELNNSDFHKSKQPHKIEKLQNPYQPQTQLPISKPSPSSEKQLPTSKNQLYPSWWTNEQQQEIQSQITSQQHLNDRTNYHYIPPPIESNPPYHYQQRPRTAYQQQPYQKYPNNNYNQSNEYYTESEESYSNIREGVNRRNSGNMIMNKLIKDTNVNSYVPKNKVNYKISYDKDLRPQSIEKKSKETKKERNGKGNNEFNLTTSSKNKMQTSNSYRRDDMKESDSRYETNKGNKEDEYYGEEYMNEREGKGEERNYGNKKMMKNESHQNNTKEIMIQQYPSSDNDIQEMQQSNNNNNENLFIESGGDNEQKQMQYEDNVNENKDMIESNYSNGDGNNNDVNNYQEQEQNQQNVGYKYKNPQNIPVSQNKNDVNNNTNVNNQAKQPSQNNMNENMNIEINANVKGNNNSNQYIQQKQINIKQNIDSNYNNNNWKNQPSSYNTTQQRNIQFNNSNVPSNNPNVINDNRNAYMQQYEYHHMNNNNYNLPNEYNVHHYDNNRHYNLQTSNYSNQYNPTEQLSMIEVSDELKNLFRNQLTYQVNSNNSLGTSELSQPSDYMGYRCERGRGNYH